ncbi:MAG: hypothetical protein ABIO70_28415 [Pseudomonadota bacterium]
MEFNFIYVVQSLRPGEKATGARLHEEELQGLLEELASVGAEIGSELVNVAGRRDLLDFLERVRNEVGSIGRFPVLHVEIHGTDDKTGLRLASGEFVPWSDLVSPLTAINAEMRNNLFLTLAVCSGAYLAQILSAAHPAPFWGLVGPHDREWDGVLLDGFTAFYKVFLTELDGRKALHALREATDAAQANAKYLFFDAESTFRKAFRAYVEQKCSAEAVETRLKWISEQARGLDALTKEQREALTADVRDRMLDPRPAFQDFRRVHFMIDKFPENDARFPMTFEEVMG